MYLPYCFERGVRDSTIRTRLKVARSYLIRLPYPCTFDDLRPLLIGLRKSKSPAYVNYIITSINSILHFCAYAQLEQKDFSNLLNGLRPKEDRRPDPNDILSVEEIEKIIDFTKSYDSNSPVARIICPEKYEHCQRMYSVLFRTLAEVGARSGEIIRLRKKDINFSNHSVTFYDTKNGDDRVVGLGVSLEDTLKEYVKDFTDNEFLFKGFSHKGNEHVSQEMVNKMFKSRCRELGIGGHRHVHQLRNSALTHLLDRGAPINRVREMVGHRKLETTMMYLRNCTNQQVRMINNFSPFEEALDFEHARDKHKEMLELLRLNRSEKVNYEVKDSNKEYSFTLRKS